MWKCWTRRPRSPLLVNQNLACVHGVSIFTFLWISNENDQPFPLRLVVVFSHFKDSHLQFCSSGMTCLCPWLEWSTSVVWKKIKACFSEEMNDMSIYLCFSPILFSFFVITRFLSGIFLTANPISQRINIYYRNVMFCFQINCHGRDRSSHTSHQCNTTATHSSVSSRCRKDSESTEHSLFLYKPFHYTK